jgi:nucleolar GTP-binding protein
MSNFTDVGIADVRTLACDALLSQRVEEKLKTRRVGDVLNRLTVTAPKPRDGRPREAAIPESVAASREAAAAAAARKAARKAAAAAAAGDEAMDDEEDYDDEEGGAGIGDGEDGAGGSHPFVKRWLERDRERVGGGPGV